MKKIPLTWFLPILLIFLATSSVFATGVGLYSGFSYMESDLRIGREDFISEKVHYYFIGGGLIIDTAVAKKKLINYRLNMGIGTVIEEPERGLYPVDHEGIRIDFYNSFGFGIFQNEIIRLWLGPQVGLRYALLEIQEYPLEYTISRFLFCPGAVLGININPGPVFTVSIDCGFRYNVGYADITSDDSSLDKSFNVRGPEVFVNLSVLFRIKDIYVRDK